MAGGGRREGAGRPVGAIQKWSRKAIIEAAKTGELPHEFLLRVSRGGMVDGREPTFEERLDAAKAAAPYYAPKLAQIEQKIETETVFKISAKPLSTEEWIAEYTGEDSLGTTEGAAGSIDYMPTD